MAIHLTRVNHQTTDPTMINRLFCMKWSNSNQSALVFVHLLISSEHVRNSRWTGSERKIERVWIAREYVQNGPTVFRASHSQCVRFARGARILLPFVSTWVYSNRDTEFIRVKLIVACKWCACWSVRLQFIRSHNKLRWMLQLTSSLHHDGPMIERFPWLLETDLESPWGHFANRLSWMSVVRVATFPVPRFETDPFRWTCITLHVRHWVVHVPQYHRDVREPRLIPSSTVRSQPSIDNWVTRWACRNVSDIDQRLRNGHCALPSSRSHATRAYP
jgi:hypothetical protein